MGDEVSGGSGEPRDKKRSIDDIIEHMTADLHSYEGQYILLGGPTAPPPPPPPQSQGPPPPPPPTLWGHYYRDSQEVIGMMDVGGGNFVNVVFSKSPPPVQQEFAHQQVQFLYQQPPPPPPQHQPPHIIDYAQRGGTTNGCLIENVVGNWAPNLNGTYSPFGGLPKDDGAAGAKQQLGQPAQPPQHQPLKKQRIVAQVKPMRPSYSDVLAKSPPLTPPPAVKQTTAVKPQQQQLPTAPPATLKPEPIKHRHQAKPVVSPTPITGTVGGKPGGGSLKRQSSSGSDDGGGGGSKARSGGGSGGGGGIAGGGGGSSDRWSSLEDLAPPPPRPQPSPTEDVVRKRRKHRASKSVSEKEDKGEVVGGVKKVQSEDQDYDDDEDVAGRSVGCQGGKPQAERAAQAKPKAREKEERKGGSAKVERSANTSRGSSKNKRSQRTYKKRESNLGTLWKKWQEQSSYYVLLFMSWLFNLLWDVTAMSTTLLIHLCGVVYDQSVEWAGALKRRVLGLARKWSLWGKKEQRFTKKPEAPPLPGSLAHNITLPTTGEEAMKRLLSCKGKDPYSILGVTSNCTDEEIKKYYKSQALLVHPDKNSQPGAEEAFKILVHAFDLIAEPEKRAAYDRYVAETNQVEQAWSELSDLISQLHEKMEYAANTIRCNSCGKRHKRELTERPSYAARYCAQCKIHHAAKEGDMWAESRAWGWGCRYYACMGGSVYDITQWAHCQGGGVQRVRPDAHSVQYRVLLGRHQPPQPEPDFEDLLNSLYSQNGSGKRGKKKNKKSK